ncbi:MAG TPA: DEAD/DEAH box helicase, partial [Verrucomicrobiae bacterium]|nr:DEAD/DEAH box helicase [Verrucomicrobiae bacterium]
MTELLCNTVEVAVAAAVDGTFHYRIPPHLADAVSPGKRLMVPFGRRRLVAYALSLSPSPVEQLRDVLEVLDSEPLLSAAEIDFLRWSASYYLHPLGEVMKGALPAGLNPSAAEEGPRARERREPFYIPISDEHAFPTAARKEREVFLALVAAQGLSASELRERVPAPGPQLRRLVEKGLVRVEEREVYRSLHSPPLSPEPPHRLNEEQRHAVEAITAASVSGSFSPFLLHGVTGSGKTEVYMQAIDHVLSRGKRALVLVPEISLTPQLVQRFRRRFSCGIAVLHSGLSPGERYDEWRRIRRGEAEVVIGARSAVFAPLERLGIIIVDEEHEASYKQGEGFRYNARDLALVRGQREKGV